MRTEEALSPAYFRVLKGPRSVPTRTRMRQGSFRTFYVELPATKDALPRVDQLVIRLLAALGHPDDDARACFALAAVELCSNIISYGTPDAATGRLRLFFTSWRTNRCGWVTLTISGNEVVIPAGELHPRFRPAHLLDEGGRGTCIVAGFTDHFVVACGTDTAFIVHGWPLTNQPPA